MANSAEGLLRQGCQHLRSAGINSADLDARLLLQAATGWSHAQLMSRARDEVPEGQQEYYRSFLDRRCLHEPVSRIIGHREFWSLDFILSPAVLDPRPDTETLVQAVLDSIDDVTVPLTILDLGTGSGCILIALLSELPNAQGIAVDQSEEALLVARANALHNGMADRISFVCGDWAGAIQAKSCDIVVSNPPYIETDSMAELMPDVLDYDPVSALDGGADGLVAYRQIIEGLSRLFVGDGRVYLEVGKGQGPDVADILAKATGTPTQIVADLAGIGRCVTGRV